MAGGKKAPSTAKANNKDNSKSKGSSSKDDKETSLKPATAINTRHILVSIFFMV